MLDAYANQNLTWKSVASVSKYNEPTYSSVTIKGRKETGNKLILNAEGQEVISSARVFTESAVANNDLIDDSKVIQVNKNIGLDGSIVFYEVYLK